MTYTYYELIIIWEDGEKQTYNYDTYEEASQGVSNMKKAFGNQISWTGINRK